MPSAKRSSVLGRLRAGAVRNVWAISNCTASNIRSSTDQDVADLRRRDQSEFPYFPIASTFTAPWQPENSPEVTNPLLESVTMAEVPLGTMQAIKPTIRAGFFLPTPALTRSVPCCNE